MAVYMTDVLGFRLFLVIWEMAKYSNGQYTCVSLILRPSSYSVDMLFTNKFDIIETIERRMRKLWDVRDVYKYMLFVWHRARLHSRRIEHVNSCGAGRFLVHSHAFNLFARTFIGRMFDVTHSRTARPIARAVAAIATSLPTKSNDGEDIDDGRISSFSISLLVFSLSRLYLGRLLFYHTLHIINLLLICW